MKWLALIILLPQAGWVLSCTFEKVEVLKSGWFKLFQTDINNCFTACYEDVRCIGIQHWKDLNDCYLLNDAENTTTKSYKDGSDVVYRLLRDDVDPTCQTFVIF